MKILFVPEAIRSAITAAGNSPEMYLKLSRLTSILSPADVAFYVYVNEAIDRIVPGEIVQSFERIDLAKQLDAAPEQSDFVKLAKQALTDLRVNPPHDLVISPEGASLRSDVMDENTIRFTAFETAGNSLGTNTRELYERVIQQVYAFYPFEQLAGLPVLAGYLHAAHPRTATSA